MFRGTCAGGNKQAQTFVHKFVIHLHVVYTPPQKLVWPLSFAYSTGWYHISRKEGKFDTPRSEMVKDSLRLCHIWLPGSCLNGT